MSSVRLPFMLAQRLLGLCLLASQMAFVIPSNTEHLKCPYDTAGDHMRTSPAPIHPDQSPAQENYFLRPIPNVVHQIWFGGASRMDSRNTDMWRQFSQLYHYRYRLWTEQDLQELQGMMPQDHYELLNQFLRIADYHGASDVARISILLAEGGTYVDVDMRPPTRDNQIIDLAKLVPMQNIVFMTEKSSRNVIESSMFVANGFIMSAPQHPLLQHLSDTMVDNCTALNQRPIDESTSHLTVHPMYLTGPFFVSRSLAGVFSIIPFNYATAYHMREYEPGAN
jgi:mannosyltransferase OCH1-like enzyme